MNIGYEHETDEDGPKRATVTRGARLAHTEAQRYNVVYNVPVVEVADRDGPPCKKHKRAYARVSRGHS